MSPDAWLDACCLRAATYAAACRDWRPGDEHFDAAVSAVTELLGYHPADVEAQLLHVVHERCSRASLEHAVRTELPGLAPAGAPAEVLHLVAGTVPGLVVESLATACTLGARSQLRPSSEDVVTRPFLAFLAAHAPDLAAQVELVDDVRWETPDAAIVYGSDETIDLVSHRTGEIPIAGYGTRSGIAVVAGPADEAVWDRLAGDVVPFRQRGCMSPSALFVVDASAEGAADNLRRGLEHAVLLRHGSIENPPALHRAQLDAAALDTIAGSVVVRVSYAEVTVHEVTDLDALRARLQPLCGLLQTAVLDGRTERTAWEQMLAAAGCTRVVAPGCAHFPDGYWPQDGIGRFWQLWKRGARS